MTQPAPGGSTVESGTEQVPAGAVSLPCAEPGADRPAASAAVQPVLGLLVHRLCQYLARDVRVSRDDLARRAQAMLTPAERWAVERADANGASSAESALVARAIDALEAVRADARIRPLLTEGHRWLPEVPFSLMANGTMVRGVIDLLVEHRDRVTVVEIKTGSARPEHRTQLDLYRTAAEMLFPGRATEAVLVYTTT